ncbi:hypothetical protein pb186bvf_012663 [Paramecium bursaria]
MQELDDLLFKKTRQDQGEDLKQIIEQIPYPHNCTISSYSDFSDNTPQKNRIFRQKMLHTEINEVKPYEIKRIQTHQDPYATDGSDLKRGLIKKQEYLIDDKREYGASGSGGSYLESMTPQRMKGIVDWSKKNVTPGDGKNIFPQVIAPSIEFSNENSVSLAFQKNQKPQLEDKVWGKQKKHMELEIQNLKKQQRKFENEISNYIVKVQEAEERSRYLSEKHKDFTCLEQLRGRNLESAKQQINQLRLQLEQKNSKIQQLEDDIKKYQLNEKNLQEALELEFRELHNQIEIKDELLQALKKDKSVEDNYKQQMKDEYERQIYEIKKYIITQQQQIDEQKQIIRESDKFKRDLEQQNNSLMSKLKKEEEYRKQDGKILADHKSKETLLYHQINQIQYDAPINNNRAYEELQREFLNQKKTIMQLTEQLQMNQYSKSQYIEPCQQCQQCREEVAQIIYDCELQEDDLQIHQDYPVPGLIRDIVTYLLAKQRQQVDQTFDEYEKKEKKLKEKVEYFKQQNEQIMNENQKNLDEIQKIIQEKDRQEQKIFEEYEMLRIQTENLQKELLQLRSSRKEDQETEILKQQIQQFKQDNLNLHQECNQLRQEQLQIKQESNQYKNLLSQIKNTESKQITQNSQYKSVQDDTEKLKQALQSQIMELSNKLAQSELQYQLIKEANNQLQQKINHKEEQDQKMQIQESETKSQESQFIKNLQNQHREMQVKVIQLENQNASLNTQLQQKSKLIEEKDKELQDKIEKRDLSQKKQSKMKEKALQDLNEDKQKLIQRIQLLEQQGAKPEEKADKNDKLIQAIKERDKKNIELHNQNKLINQSYKETEEQLQNCKDEIEKFKKQIQFKSQEIKALLEQIKILQEKNNENTNKIQYLQQQISNYESEFGFQDHSPQVPEKLRSNPSQKNLETKNNKVSELVEGFNQYSQEFYQLKKQFAEKLKNQDALQENIQTQQQKIYQLTQENQKLQNDYQILSNKYEQLISRRQYEETTNIRGSAATGDSLNIRSFLNHEQDDFKKVTNVFQQNLKSVSEQSFSIIELIQPEVISLDDTIHIFREILRRSIKSVEMIRAICSITEIKELLNIVMQVDEKIQNSVIKQSQESQDYQFNYGNKKRENKSS